MENNGTYCLAPKCDGDFADLYYIKTRDTASSKVEIHAVSAQSGWKKRTLDVNTGLALEDNRRWLMAHFTHQKLPHLVYIKTGSTDSGKTEVHVNESREYAPDSL